MTKLAKIGLFGLFINYYPFHIMFGHLIPRGSYLFFGMTVVGILGGMDEHRKVYAKDTTIQTWCIYWVLSFVLSVFALSPEYATSSLISFAVKIFIIFAISYVCEKDGNVFFAFQLLAATAVLSALAAFIQAGDITRRLDLVSGARVSVNDFGSLMAYGCFAVIVIFYYRDSYHGFQNKFRTRIIEVAISMLLVYELFISGSRKALYAVILLYTLMIILVWLRAKGTFDLSNLITIAIIGLVIYMIYEFLLEDIIQYTSLYRRVFGDKAEAAVGSDMGRMNLYHLAFEHFLKNPLIGLGFDNFRYKHNVYTHSTYAEALACSGLMGLLYLIPVFRILGKLFTLANEKRIDFSSRQMHTMMLIFYIEFLFIGIGIPYMYKEIPCIVFGMMIAWIRISFTELADGGVINQNRGLL